MRAGFSLVEVIVAMVLLSVGLLAVAGSGLLAAQLLREAEVREYVAQRAADLLDSLVVNQVGGAGTAKLERYRLDWTAGERSVLVRAELPDGSVFDLEAAR